MLSALPRRLIARPNSYGVVRELERREQRIQTLLGGQGGFVELIATEPQVMGIIRRWMQTTPELEDLVNPGDLESLTQHMRELESSADVRRHPTQTTTAPTGPVGQSQNSVQRAINADGLVESLEDSMYWALGLAMLVDGFQPPGLAEAAQLQLDALRASSPPSPLLWLMKGNDHEVLKIVHQACRLADRIGDCISSVVTRWNLVDEYNAHLSESHLNTCRCLSWISNLVDDEPFGSNLTPCTLTWHSAEDPEDPEDPEDRVLVPMRLLAHAIRSAQINFMKGLSQDDRLFLRLLGKLVEFFYRLYVPKGMDVMHWSRMHDAFSEMVFRLGATPTLWALLSQKRLRGADNSDDDLEQLRLWGDSLDAPLEAIVDEDDLYTDWLWEGEESVSWDKVWDPSQVNVDPVLSKVFQEIKQDLGEEDENGNKYVPLILPPLKQSL
jgi:hypothetical protein